VVREVVREPAGGSSANLSFLMLTRTNYVLLDVLLCRLLCLQPCPHGLFLLLLDVRNGVPLSPWPSLGRGLVLLGVVALSHQCRHPNALPSLSESDGKDSGTDIYRRDEWQRPVGDPTAQT
jgi:hypothetical protein